MWNLSLFSFPEPSPLLHYTCLLFFSCIQREGQTFGFTAMPSFKKDTYPFLAFILTLNPFDPFGAMQVRIHTFCAAERGLILLAHQATRCLMSTNLTTV